MNNSATTLASTNLELKPDQDIHPEEREEYESTPHSSSSLPADKEASIKQEVDHTADTEAAVPVSRVPTRVSINDVKAIPNGGLLAWLQVLGAWMLFFDTW